MKKLAFILTAILIISIFSSCTAKNDEFPDEQEPITITLPETSSTEETETEEEIPIVHDSYDTKELSRDDNYKLMEMYAYDNDWKITRRVTFELPVEWQADDSSVFGLIENDFYIIKLDVWNVGEATPESITEEGIIEELEIIGEGSYSTNNYEIFWFKHNSDISISIVTSYYLYANDERLHISTYNFTGEDTPEYEAIFKRIVESMRF